MSTAEACVQMVRTQEPSANGVTYGVSGSWSGSCYAEFGMTGTNGIAGVWQTCQLLTGKRAHRANCGTASPAMLTHSDNPARRAQSDREAAPRTLRSRRCGTAPDTPLRACRPSWRR